MRVAGALATLEELQEAPPQRLRTFFHKQRCRYRELIERRLVGIRQAIPAIRDRAVIEAKSTEVKVSAQVIRIWFAGLRIGPQDRGGGGSASRFFHL